MKTFFLAVACVAALASVPTNSSAGQADATLCGPFARMAIRTAAARDDGRTYSEAVASAKKSFGSSQVLDISLANLKYLYAHPTFQPDAAKIEYACRSDEWFTPADQRSPKRMTIAAPPFIPDPDYGQPNPIQSFNSSVGRGPQAEAWGRW